MMYIWSIVFCVVRCTSILSMSLYRVHILFSTWLNLASMLWFDKTIPTERQLTSFSLELSTQSSSLDGVCSGKASKYTLSGNTFVFHARPAKNELSCLTYHWWDVTATTCSYWLARQQTHLPDNWANSIHWLRCETVEQWTLRWDCAVTLLFPKSRINIDAQIECCFPIKEIKAKKKIILKNNLRF